MEEQFLLLLSAFQRRLRWVVAFQEALIWGWWGGWVALLAAALLKVMEASPEDLWNAPWVVLVFGLCGFCWSWGRPPSLRRVALLTDAAHGLKERTVSAFEQQQSWRPKTAVSAFLLQDGLRALEAHDPAQTFPNPWRRPLAHLLLPLVLLAAVNLSPSWGNLLHRTRQIDRLALRRSGQRLEQLARRLREQNPRSSQAHHLASKLETLARKLRSTTAPTDRLTAAAELDQTLRQLRREAERSLPFRKTAAPASGDSAKLRQLAQQARSGNSPDLLRNEIARAAARTDDEEQRKRLEQAAHKLSDGKKAEAAEELEKAAQDQEQTDKKESELAQQAEEGLQAENDSLDPGASGRRGKASGDPANQPGDSPAGQGVAINPASGNAPKGKGRKTDQADFGKGTTNEEQKAGASPKNTPLLERQADGKPAKQEAFKKLYGVERQHFLTADTKVKGQRGKGRVLAGQGTGWGQPRIGGRSALSPEQSFLESKADAEQAITQGSIPGPYQDVVRNYFQGIDPR